MVALGKRVSRSYVVYVGVPSQTECVVHFTQCNVRYMSQLLELFCQIPQLAFAVFGEWPRKFPLSVLCLPSLQTGCKTYCGTLSFVLPSLLGLTCDVCICIPWGNTPLALGAYYSVCIDHPYAHPCVCACEGKLPVCGVVCTLSHVSDNCSDGMPVRLWHVLSGCIRSSWSGKNEMNDFVSLV